MARETREEAIARANAAGSSAMLYNIALQETLDDNLQMLARVSFDGEQITARTTRLDGPHGGILILVRRIKNQRADVSAYYAEQWLADRRRFVSARLDDEAMAWNHIAECLTIAMQNANAA